MNKSYLTVSGFILMLLGILSIVLSVVGLNLEILGFLYEISSGFAFLIYILMVMTGAILMYISKSNIEE
jgi:hypothetical protein